MADHPEESDMVGPVTDGPLRRHLRRRYDGTFSNASRRRFTSIENEAWRRYVYPLYADDGHHLTVLIRDPRWLSVSDSGRHYVADARGYVHVVQPGWLALTWEPREGYPSVVA